MEIGRSISATEQFWMPLVTYGLRAGNCRPAIGRSGLEKRDAPRPLPEARSDPSLAAEPVKATPSHGNIRAETIINEAKENRNADLPSMHTVRTA